jgi:ElaB/YqjD/DUF883 family membrane-anchored ribosome-binding protein
MASTKRHPTDVVRSTAAATRPALDRTRRELRSLDRSARGYVGEHPLVALVVAASAGYALGRILRGLTPGHRPARGRRWA